MNTDPTINGIVFEVKSPAGLQTFRTQVPTQADDGIRQAWAALTAQRGFDPVSVTRIYSEWEPSLSDKEFIRHTFTTAAVTYSFSRPTAGDWDRALRDAEQVIKNAMTKGASP